MSFVPDLLVRVHTPEGKTEEVDTQRDVEAGKFLDQLRDPFRLRSKDAEGRHVRWHLYDRDDRRLDPSKSLGDNGVRAGQDLFLREESEKRPEPEPERRPEPRTVVEHKGDSKALVRCDNGHYYAPEKFKTCPYCDARAPRR